MAKRDTHKYTLRVGNRITYRGITNNPKRRAGEHERAGRPGKMRIEGPPVTRKRALAWERRMKVVR